MNLEEYFRENPECAVAFSGGCDSAYLAYAAKKYARRTKAYFFKTQFVPESSLNDAVRFSEEYGIRLEIIRADALGIPNTDDRCYYCKRMMMTRIKGEAAADGFKLVIDGTNASDNESGRPGMRALKELCVESPLKICGMSKSDVRKLSREAGLFTADIPSFACLATRIAAGEIITEEKLARIDRGESFMKSMGFEDFRVRLSGETARIEVCEAEFGTVFENRGKIAAELGKYFESVTLDLKAR